MHVQFRRVEAVAVVELDNAPVNAIGLSIREGLQNAIDWIAAEDHLSHVVLTGLGQAFAAGGDAREFDAPPIAPHLNDITMAIENSPVPWVAAINGVALGGGCELALACRYRIAAAAVRIGLPEVTLGVVPGAGGTQRLPRLIGLNPALRLIATGRPITAEQALEMGLVDRIAAEPVAEALKLDSERLAACRPTLKYAAPTPDEDALLAARNEAERKMAHQNAPLVAIDLVASSATTTLPEALAAERKAFIALRGSDQARALRHLFFAERAAKSPDGLHAKAGPIDKVAVVGGGTMGASIAYALLNAGLAVILLETDGEGVERARANVERIIAASLERGLIDEAAAETRRKKFRADVDYARASGATLAIEAAFEDMDVKRSVFRELERCLSDDAIVATNTSYLDVDEIAASVREPSRVVGLHFFAPAHIMKLLEIVRGARSSERALATGFALAKRLGKVPVLAGVCDGFIGNRIVARYREAADTVLMDASTPWEIDEAMVAFGYAMGPYESQDLSGLDIAHANRRRQDATRDPARRYIPIADRMVELGKLGRKAGAGWYRYPGGGGKVDDPIVADLALEEARFAGITRRDMTGEDIRERLLLAMINEAADILDEGIAASARDIDLVTVFGYGFPRWRGGLMYYADTLGARRIVARLEALAKEDPIAWRVSPLLRRCAEAGECLRDR
jgi:3-hydroxyacyl-CoA dehydrogenase